jgi:protein phosphatase PTC1
MIIRFDKEAVIEKQVNKDLAIGVEGDASTDVTKVSEVEKIVGTTKQKIAEGDVPAIGVSASNSGLGHDLAPLEDSEPSFTPTIIQGSVEEEPSSIEESPDVMMDTPVDKSSGAAK